MDSVAAPNIERQALVITGRCFLFSEECPPLDPPQRHKPHKHWVFLMSDLPQEPPRGSPDVKTNDVLCRGPEQEKLELDRGKPATTQ